MLIKKPDPIAPSEITPKPLWMRRRELIKGAAAGAAWLAAWGLSLATVPRAAASTGQIPNRVRSPLSTDEPPTSLAGITSYNNYSGPKEYTADLRDP